MSLKERLFEKALELNFEDVGCTGTEPLAPYISEIDSRPPEMYDWILNEKFSTRRGAGLAEKHPWARSVLVLIRNYHKRAFPPELIGKIGRCYQVDERIEKREEHHRVRAYFDFLKKEGIHFLFDLETPARMAAARAGVVSYGKNCFAYSARAMRGSSWIEIIPLLLDAELEPDQPSVRYGCPKWCRNACMAACPTKAIYAPGKMNPKRCVAYNTYYSNGITPAELREPMGTWVYGCDRCQQVCPRNEAYTNQPFPVNHILEERSRDFRLDTLLTMTDEHYLNKVWPLCFYISKNNKAKWQMNAARALGNQGDRDAVPILIESLRHNPDPLVRGMCAWALGKLAGPKAKEALEKQLSGEDGVVREEIKEVLRSL